MKTYWTIKQPNIIIQTKIKPDFYIFSKQPNIETKLTRQLGAWTVLLKVAAVFGAEEFFSWKNSGRERVRHGAREDASGKEVDVTA